MRRVNYRAGSRRSTEPLYWVELRFWTVWLEICSHPYPIPKASVTPSTLYPWNSALRLKYGPLFMYFALRERASGTESNTSEWRGPRTSANGTSFIGWALVDMEALLGTPSGLSFGLMLTGAFKNIEWSTINEVHVAQGAG